jgi:hypothetical protein
LHASPRPRIPEKSMQRFKAMIVAPPKTGKTGSIVPLVNDGRFRVILAAFDPGYDVLLNLIEPEAHSRLTILPFEDRRGNLLGLGDKGAAAHGIKGEPLAFVKFVNFLNDGKARLAKCQGGELVDLGPSDAWGSDTILVVDNLTSLSGTIMARALHARGANIATRIRRDWMLAQDEADSVLIQMSSSAYAYHLIVLAHYNIQGPREFEDESRNDHAGKADYNNELKKREADLIPTKMVPTSIGRALSRNLTRHFPAVCWCCIDPQGRRIFDLKPVAHRDSGVPVRPGALPEILPIENGLLTIFNAVTVGGNEVPEVRGGEGTK